jgi:penicillin-binding protein 2
MSEKVEVSSEALQMTTEEQRALSHDAQPPTQRPPETRRLQIRYISLFAIITLVFLLFFFRLWNLQVVRGEEFSQLAQINRSRLVSIDAPRGIIYDRSGQPLVHNVPRFSVAIVPGYLPDDDLETMEIYRKLSLWLNMPITTKMDETDLVAGQSGGASSADRGFALRFRSRTETDEGPGEGIKDIVDEAIRTGQYYREITIKDNISRETAMIISEQTMKLPGVKMQINATREYPNGPTMAHVLGYAGGIPSEEAQDYEAKGYDANVDKVGLTGIEWEAESYLRGVKGSKYIEEDVAGREVAVVGEPNDPVPGDNVYLSIDAGLQKVAAEALQAEIDEINRSQGREWTRRGAAIAMNPQTGQILALVSLPSFDPNLFTQGISQAELSKLYNDEHRPLLNHAIYDHVAPGSIFKLIPASAALEEGVITPKTIIYDPGSIVIPNKYFPNDPGQAKRLTCWLKTGHGNVDLLHGLAYSCDVYFWEVGAGYDVPNQPKFEGLGIDRLVKYSQMFGLGQITGIDLPGESTGHVPTTQWKRRTYGETWSTGDTYNFSIGQGYLEVTPIQMLNVAAAVANGGTLYKPQIIDHVTTADGKVVRSFTPQVLSKVNIQLENLQLVQQGMEASAMWGTSTKAQVPGVRVAGKTGTAEFCDDLAVKDGFCYTGHTPYHAWFISFAPVGNPQIAVVVYIYNGGEGSERAAPVAQKILDYFFKNSPKM